MDDLISRFWDKYIEKTISYGVKTPSQRWFVRYVEEYIKVHQPRRLAMHEADDIRVYLTDIGRRGHLKDSQYKQVVCALKILLWMLLSLHGLGVFHGVNG